MRTLALAQTSTIDARRTKGELIRVMVWGVDGRGRESRVTFYLPPDKALDLGLALAGAV